MRETLQAATGQFPPRLSRALLPGLPATIGRPTYDLDSVRSGIVHLGLGAFHRAHQAVFTEDAIEAGGRDWGVTSVSMRKADVADALTQQDNLFCVETLGEVPGYRVIGAVRRALTLPQDPAAVIEAVAAAQTRLVTLTITEAGYCLTADGLDLTHPDIRHDLGAPNHPRSAIGVLAAGLAARRLRRSPPLTVISCDNLGRNGARLGQALIQFVEQTDKPLAAWIQNEITFPETMVDCIVPAASDASLARAAQALGCTDAAAVQREPFAEWIIQDQFVGPRPRWPADVVVTTNVGDYRRLKLHVLNAAHSALAYLGPRRGHHLVREAIADGVLADFLDQMMTLEVAAALPDLPVRDYWTKVLARFQNPMIDHRLDQIALDGATKLTERVVPLLLANAARGAPTARMAEVLNTWASLDPSQPSAAARLHEQGCISASTSRDLGAALHQTV